MLFKNKIFNYKPFSDFSKTVITNSIASVLFTVFVLIFSLVRTSLISNIYGETSIGFLAIAIGILPFISSTHGGIISVSKYNLYDRVYKKQYAIANQVVADMKVQYYFFGSIYAIITIVLAFAFPFFFNQNGNIALDNQIIPWYESTLYILSNCVETFTNYLIIPISIILFYIIKKSYVSNFINLLIAFISNSIIFTLLLLQLFGIININFIVMNIIITTILGLKTLFVVMILKPLREKFIPWYQRYKIKNKKISKDMVIAIITQYFKQFNSDLYSIVFIIATNFLLSNNPNVGGISTYHEGHMHSGFATSGIYYIYLFLITSSYEVIHSIVDNAVPSMAEHVVINQKIHKSFFERYNSLVIFIASYTITTYIFTAAFSSTAMMGLEHLNSEELILMFIIVIPFIIDIYSVSYDHIIPVYGDFKKIMKYTLIKVIINVICVVVFIASITLNVQESFKETSIFISIVAGWCISSLVYLIINRRYVVKRLDEKINFNIINILKQNTYIIFSLFVMAIIFGFGNYFNNIENIEKIGKWSYMIIAFVGLANFFVVIFFMKLTNKKEYNYYLKEFKCMVNHYHEQYKKKESKEIIWDAINNN